MRLYPYKHKDEWHEPTIPEMKAFLGLAKVLTYHSFIQINSYLHFCDEETADGTHKLYNVKPYLDYLQERFDSEFSLGRDISIDECVIPFKGILGIKLHQG